VKCTWVNCINEAIHSQKDRNGNEWANLCEGHDSELEDAISSGMPKRILNCWVKASGGSKKMAEEMSHNIVKTLENK
jgi:hypothetical protein